MIGDFDYIEAYTSGDFSGEPVLCRVYTPVGLADQGHYSLDLAIKVNDGTWPNDACNNNGALPTYLTFYSLTHSLWNTFLVCSIYLIRCLSWTWWRFRILLLVLWKTGA